MEKNKELLSIFDNVLNEADGFISSSKEMVSHCEKILYYMKDLRALFTSEPSAITKTYTKEDIRAVLSEKSANGYGKEVKALLIKFGADKLSDLSTDLYEAVITEAKEISNE